MKEGVSDIRSMDGALIGKWQLSGAGKGGIWGGEGRGGEGKGLDKAFLLFLVSRPKKAIGDCGTRDMDRGAMENY